MRGKQLLSTKDIVKIIIPILVGFLIYFSCRVNSLLYYQWIPVKQYIGLDTLQNSLLVRCTEAVASWEWLEIMVYSIPAALYAFSLTFYIKKRYLETGLSNRTLTAKILIYASTIALIAWGPEVLQLGLLAGSFDTQDAWTALVAAGIALVA